jgi:hypothetical protein
MGNEMKIDDALIGLAASVAGRACELLADGWVKGQMSKSVDGSPVQFCIHGALDLALDEVFGTDRKGVRTNVNDIAVAFICDEAFGKMISHSGGIPAASFNDAKERKHQEVLNVVGNAADRLWDIAVENENGSTWEPSKWADVDVSSEQAQNYLHATLN